MCGKIVVTVVANGMDLFSLKGIENDKEGRSL